MWAVTTRAKVWLIRSIARKKQLSTERKSRKEENMAVVNCYKVHYHFERNGKKVSPDYVDYVQASGPDYVSLQTVLSNNNKILGGNTLQISAVQLTGPSSDTVGNS